MSAKTQNEKIIFGLKVKQLRKQKKLSFAELSSQSKMSVSYLNEIEKGKKYPKSDKIESLSKALDISYEDLTSTELDKNLAPVGELLKSNFLNELPLDLFGIELSKIVEIIANAPTRVGAFISTLLDLSRTYALREENFYFGALRSYLELNNNYFEDLEEAVKLFGKQFKIPNQRPIPVELLENLLKEQFGYKIVPNGLDEYPELQGLRAVFLTKKKQLLLNSKLTDIQTSFQLGKELGFQFLELKERANTSSLLKSKVFEEVLNHSKAIYFSVALHIPLIGFVKEVETLFSSKKWNGEAMLNLMKKYDATPEMLFHRLTNVLPEFFGLQKLFFLRFVHNPDKDHFSIDRELHLSRQHHPHGNAVYEHYCRRWVSLSLLHDLAKNEGDDPIIGIQRSRYIGTEDEYLCFTIARKDYPSTHKNVSVTIGLLINDAVKKKVKFLNDSDIPVKDVNQTCERCAIESCDVRATPPLVIEKRERIRNITETLEKLEN